MTGRASSSDMERNLHTLPVRHGGLGIANPVKIAQVQISASRRLTAELVQDFTRNFSVPENEIPAQVSKANLRREIRTAAKNIAELHRILPKNLLHARLVASERGTSSWLTVLPLIALGFALPKGAFCDALCLGYGGPVPELPTKCLCGSPLEIEHALSCRFGGLPIRRHNEVRNLQGSCMRNSPRNF